MHAVLRIDLQPGVGAIVIADDLIHPGRAVALFRRIVFGQVDADRHFRILQFQVDRLILLMIGIGNEYRGKAIETDLAVGLGIFDFRRFGCLFQTFVIGMGGVQGPRHIAAEQLLFDAVVKRAENGAELGKGRTEVPRLVQLLVHPGFPHPFRIIAQHIGGVIAAQRLVHRFRRQHAGLHGRVAALDLGHVQETGAAADQRPAREHQFGNALQPAFVQGTRAVGYALAALEGRADRRMGLETLELLEGGQMGIAVIQADDETDSHLIVFEMIDEGAAIGAVVHRPSRRMQHQPLLVLFGIDFP